MRTHETDRILAIFTHMYLQIKGLLPIGRLTTDKNCPGYQQATNHVAESPSLHLNPRLLRPLVQGLVACACFQLRQDTVGDRLWRSAGTLNRLVPMAGVESCTAAKRAGSCV